MIQTQKVTVIIPAAGSGKRMRSTADGKSKQFMDLQNKPMLVHTLEKFEHARYTDEIILVCPGDGIAFVQEEILKKFYFKKVAKIVIGGNERQDSVYEGLRAVENTDIVLVHDAVRPFISVQKIDELIEACVKFDAAILAVPTKDTIAAQDENQFVAETLERSKLWHVQTPQAFAYRILLEAFKKAYAEKFYGTDEAMLVGRLHQKIKIVQGEYENIKITSPDDLAMAEVILRNLEK